MMLRLKENPGDIDLLASVDAAVEMGNALPFEVTFWEIQNIYWEMLQAAYPEYRFRSGQGDEQAGEWIRLFSTLGGKLSVRLPEG